MSEGRRLVVTSGGHCLEGFVADPEVQVILDVSPMTLVYHDREKRAIAIDRGGRSADAIPLYREILASNPRMVDAWESLAKALHSPALWAAYARIQVNVALRRAARRPADARAFVHVRQDRRVGGNVVA